DCRSGARSDRPGAGDGIQDALQQAGAGLVGTGSARGAFFGHQAFEGFIDGIVRKRGQHVAVLGVKSLETRLSTNHYRVNPSILKPAERPAWRRTYARPMLASRSRERRSRMPSGA